MNQIATRSETGTAVAVDNDQITVLQNSLYPGAKRESVMMVLAYCKAANLNPMLKPVHIVPMNVKKPGTNQYEWRDVIMPGIGHYRTQATKTGCYVGKSEPEYGPTINEKIGGVEIAYPEWCKVVVRRKIGQNVAEFAAVEYWLENYATSGRESKAPNAMWRKRPFGQLAKCTEAQALRMAFPDEIGENLTADEMEGKDVIEDVQYTAVAAETAKPERATRARRQLDSFANRKPSEPDPEPEAKSDEYDPNEPPLTERDPDATASADPEEGDEDAPLPAMPEEAAEQWAKGRWMKAWVWWSDEAKQMDRKTLDAFIVTHADLLQKVREYSPEHAAKVEAFVKRK